jgi:Transcription factor WhiB
MDLVNWPRWRSRFSVWPGRFFEWWTSTPTRSWNRHGPIDGARSWLGSIDSSPMVDNFARGVRMRRVLPARSSAAASRRKSRGSRPTTTQTVSCRPTRGRAPPRSPRRRSRGGIRTAAAGGGSSDVPLLNDWRAHAACAAACQRGDADRSWWFPNRDDATSPAAGGSYARARAICAGCLVRQECLDDALLVEEAVTPPERCGMFGGCSPEERKALARRRRSERGATVELSP